MLAQPDCERESAKLRENAKGKGMNHRGITQRVPDTEKTKQEGASLQLAADD